MKKDFLGDFLGHDEQEDIRDESLDASGTVFVGTESSEMEEVQADSASSVSLFTSTQKKKIIAPAEPEIASLEKPTTEPVNEEVYEEALRVAELKFGFMKWVILAIPVNIFFFTMASFQIQPSGKMWFLWPLMVTGILIAFQYFRAFIFKGRSLQSLIDDTVHHMAIRESKNKKYKDFL